MTERQEFDPRFDPAFQRGYVPPVQPPSIARVPDELISQPPAGAASPMRAASPSPEDAESASGVGDSDVPRRINPYIVVLWVVGVVCSVGGIALPLLGYAQFFKNGFDSSGPTLASQTLQTFAFVFSGPLVTVGLGTIVGVVLLSTVRSSRRAGIPAKARS